MSGLVFNDCVTPTFSRVGSQPKRKTYKREEKGSSKKKKKKRSLTLSFDFPDIFVRYTHTKEMLDLVCLLTGYLLSKHFSVCNTEKKREKQQKKEANVPLVRWHRNCFPLFLSDRVRRKKKILAKVPLILKREKKEKKGKKARGKQKCQQLNQVITKHLSDLVHVTTTHSPYLFLLSLFAVLVVGRHVNEPKCKTVELNKNKEKKLRTV